MLRLSEFISGRGILVVDPFTYSAYRNESGHVVRHLKATWESVVDSGSYSVVQPDCLVLLGAQSLDRVVGLVGSFRRAVVEMARHNKVASDQWRAALPGLLERFRLVAHLELNVMVDVEPGLVNKRRPESGEERYATAIPRDFEKREMWVLQTQINSGPQRSDDVAARKANQSGSSSAHRSGQGKQPVHDFVVSGE